jgi:hypothetical protein
MIDQSLVDAIAAILVVIVPVLGAYIKKIADEKGIGETQVDMIFDFADAELAGILKLYPDNQEVAELRIKLLKLKSFYNDPTTTAEEMKALLNAVQNIKFRTLKQQTTPSQ